MSITQTVDIPASRRLTIDVPYEIPTGRTILIFKPISEAETASFLTSQETLPNNDKSDLLDNDIISSFNTVEYDSDYDYKKLRGKR